VNTTRTGDSGGNGRAGGLENAPRRGARSNGSQPPIAALDLGTNNCRLLVARPEGESFVVVDAFSRAVRLGEGVEHSNQLGEAAQARALKALRICASKIRQHRVTDARIIATEACRRAVNGAGFIRRVTREIGLQMEIISAEEEARLAVAGCAPLLDPEAEQLLVFDIGGGSTELIWIDMSRTPPSRRVSLIRTLAPTGGNGDESANARAAAAHIADWISVPMGVSTLHERFVSAGTDAQRFAAMSRHFEEHLAPFIPFHSDDRAGLTRRLQRRLRHRHDLRRDASWLEGLRPQQGRWPLAADTARRRGCQETVDPGTRRGRTSGCWPGPRRTGALRRGDPDDHPEDLAGRAHAHRRSGLA
jgi:hypothetical protein